MPPVKKNAVIQPVTDQTTADRPSPVRLPEILADKMRDAHSDFVKAQDNFKAQVKAWTEGFMATQPPAPVGYTTMVDIENGVVFFIPESEINQSSAPRE